MPSTISRPVSTGPAARPRSRLPGPRSRTPLGQLWPVRRDIIGFLTRLAAEYGDVASFTVAGMPLVLLNHPDHIHNVLQANHHNFVKGRPLRLARLLLGEGLLTAEGDAHLRQSRMIRPAFHADRIRAYGAVMTAYASRLSTGWTDGTTVDVMEEMVNLAVAIAGKTMFNWDVGATTATGIGTALHEATSLFSRASIPGAEWLLRLPLPSSRRFYRAKTHLDRTIYELIAQRRREPRDRGDLLSMLMVTTDSEGDGLTMTDAQVRDAALTLFVTALDTTSLALTWTWYLLSQHPTIEARLHAEIDRVLGDTAATVDDIARLSWTRAVFMEAMRLYPPIYAIAREAIGDFRVGEYTIPSGTLVLVSPYVMQRDARYYPEPDRFDPERWEGEGSARQPRYTYFPFGGGLRGCIGQAYAMQEGVLALATLAQRWRMRLVPNHVVAFHPLINLRPRGGMPMRLHARHG